MGADGPFRDSLMNSLCEACPKQNSVFFALCVKSPATVVTGIVGITAFRE
jgi:hypothetical protein